MFSKIKTKLKKDLCLNKRSLLFIIGIISIFFLTSEMTFAATDPKVAEAAAFVDGLIKLITTLLALLTVLVTLFLDPSWISGSIFGLDSAFKELWLLVSNIVYFIFAFILVWIAFMNILGKSQDKYQLKTALPKFVVGIMIVPFTWFFIQFVLSISSILTVAAITLPADTFSEYQKEIDKTQLPSFCTIDLGSTALTDEYFDCPPGDFVLLGELMKGESGNSSIFGVIASYTYGILAIDKLDKIGTKNINEGMKTLIDLLVKIGFDLLFILVYAILMITLGIALATRGIYLWIYTIISPVFGLMYFFDKKEGGGDGFIKNFSIQEFIALAMVPVYTMLALSFGLLFIFVIGNGMTEDKATDFTGGVSNIELNDEGVVIGEGTTEFTLKVKGSVLSSTNSEFQVMSFLSQTAATSLGVVGNLILQMFSVAVLWMAIMAALKSSSITTAVTQPIRDFGSQVGGLISKMPTYAPIFPGGQSMTGLSNMASVGSNHFRSKAIEKSSTFMKDNNLFQSKNTSLTAKSITLKGKIDDGISIISKEIFKDLKDTITSADDIKGLSNNSNFRDALLAITEHKQMEGKFTEKDIKGLKSGDQTSIANIIGALDRFAKDNKEVIKVDLIEGKNLSASSIDNVGKINSFLKGQAGNEETSKTTTAQNTTNISESAQKAREAIGTLTVTNNTVMIGGVDTTLDGFNSTNKTIANSELLAKDLKKSNLWIDGEFKEKDFTDLMEKLGVKKTDGKIEELKTELGIDGTETK